MGEAGGSAEGPDVWDVQKEPPLNKIIQAGDYVSDTLHRSFRLHHLIIDIIFLFSLREVDSLWDVGFRRGHEMIAAWSQTKAQMCLKQYHQISPDVPRWSKHQPLKTEILAIKRKRAHPVCFSYVWNKIFSIWVAEFDYTSYNSKVASTPGFCTVNLTYCLA